MAANPLFNSVSSHKSNRTNSSATCLQDVNRNQHEFGSVKRNPRVCPDIGKSPRRRSGMADDREQEPPGKKRRVEGGGGGDANELWDDSDFDFTQEQLENIDCMVSMSQMGGGQPSEKISNVGPLVGHGMPRSTSTGDAKASKVKSLSLSKERSGTSNVEYPSKVAGRSVMANTSGTSSSGIGSLSSTNMSSLSSLNNGQNKMKAPLPKSAVHAKPKLSTSSVSASSSSSLAGPSSGLSPDWPSTQKEFEAMKKTLGEYKQQVSISHGQESRPWKFLCCRQHRQNHRIDT